MDSDPPRPLREIIQPFQRDLYRTLAPLFEAAAGLPRPGARQQCFVVAPKGSSKTSSVAQLINWLLNFSARQRPVSVSCVSSDKEQASILLERMRAEGDLNPWLRLQHRQNRVIGPKGKCTVLAADVDSCQGHIDDLTLIDEYSFVRKKELVMSMIAGAAKRPSAGLILIGNAGIRGSWQEELWLLAKSSPVWATHEVPALSASWIPKAKLDEQKRIQPPHLWRRLFLNEWVDAGDVAGYLTRDQVEACLDYARQPGGQMHSYVAALDAGFSRDRFAAAVLHAEGEHCFLDDMQVWMGSKNSHVRLSEVEQWLEERTRKFRIRKLVCDNTQLEGTCQRFEASGLEVVRQSFRGINHQRLGECVRGLAVSRRLHLFPKAGLLTLNDGRTEDLVDELSDLLIEDKAGGSWRVNHRSNGHDDRFSVLAMGALECVGTPQLGDVGKFMDVFGTKKEDKEDTVFKRIKHFAGYGIYSPEPLIDGQPTVIKSLTYRGIQEAAFAADECHRLLGLEGENRPELSEERKREIAAQVRQALADMGALPSESKKRKA